ncbi:hypothetical protein BC833DRAFT_613424 [Globomyces pollinis-pini]|nr:hypothetical protein BC833DRAFT_613424 [Globomyces pollinis-pini]
MPKRFLNIEYSGTKTEVDITEAERLGEVQDAVKAKYGSAMANIGAAQLQLYDQLNQNITDLDDIPEDYCKKVKDGGLFLVVHGPQEESVNVQGQLVALQAEPAMAQN